MDKSTTLLSLEESLNIYKKSKIKPQGFNLFCSMFNWHNERYLHSSFIGMMLSMKREFFVSFLEELHRADTGFLRTKIWHILKGVHAKSTRIWVNTENGETLTSRFEQYFGIFILTK